MASFLMGLIYGILGSIIIVPIVIFVIVKMLDTRERRNVKMMIAKQEYLTPIDERDYDVKIWPNIIPETSDQLKQRMGTMFVKKNEPGLNNG